jgi:hypothetical protein
MFRIVGARRKSAMSFVAHSATFRILGRREWPTMRFVAAALPLPKRLTLEHA